MRSLYKHELIRFAYAQSDIDTLSEIDMIVILPQSTLKTQRLYNV